MSSSKFIVAALLTIVGTPSVAPAKESCDEDCQHDKMDRAFDLAYVVPVSLLAAASGVTLIGGGNALTDLTTSERQRLAARRWAIANVVLGTLNVVVAASTLPFFEGGDPSSSVTGAGIAAGVLGAASLTAGVVGVVLTEPPAVPTIVPALWRDEQGSLSFSIHLALSY